MNENLYPLQLRRKKQTNRKLSFSPIPLLPPSTLTIYTFTLFFLQNDPKLNLHRNAKFQVCSQFYFHSTHHSHRLVMVSDSLSICLAPNSFASFHGEIGITGKCHSITMSEWWPRCFSSVSPWYYGFRADRISIVIFTDRGALSQIPFTLSLLIQKRRLSPMRRGRHWHMSSHHSIKSYRTRMITTALHF